MTELNTLIDEVSQLISSETPALAEMRLKLAELDEYAHSAQYEELNLSDRSRFQAAFKELRDAIRRLENVASPSAAPAVPGFETSRFDQQSSQPAEPAEPLHDPQAELQMEDAEKLFYGGRYAEAIKFYDQVLRVEPKWERARQHRRESENYLRTGYIPSVALPPEAASAFGKAQSAARLGRYADALSILSKAQMALKDLGIQRWQDGQEFEQKLQQYLDAESVYSEGVQLFAQGMIDDGIERVDAAAQATGLPKYIDRAQEMRKAKATMQSIAESLNNSNADPKNVIKVKTDLDALFLQFGENPAFQKLKERFQSLIPTLVEPLKDQIRSLKTQSDRAQTLDAVTTSARQAKELLDQMKNLGYQDEITSQLQADIDKLFRELQRYEDELQQGLTVFNSNRSWPAAAAQISQNVRARYPNDPRVVELNRLLVPYRNTRLGIRSLLILLGVALVGGLLVAGYNMTRSYIISLTPTLTPTATFAPTSTPLPPTATLTPRPTATFTITPTPLTGVVARDVWVANGCYSAFKAIGQIPGGSSVRFLPTERRFDNLNRECLLVEYTGKDNISLIGWILIADLK
jgi:tetratricopeptide (TPR) repeat protein